MKYFVSTERPREDHLRCILLLFLAFALLNWVTNLLLHMEIGLSPGAVQSYYLGSEEAFRPPKSYRGLLEEAHFHSMAMGILLLTLNHLLLFTGLGSRWITALIFGSFLAALGDVAGGWLILYVHPAFAYFKLLSFIVLQLTMAVAMGAIALTMTRPRMSERT